MLLLADGGHSIYLGMTITFSMSRFYGEFANIVEEIRPFEGVGAFAGEDIGSVSMLRLNKCYGFFISFIRMCLLSKDVLFTT